MRIKEIILRRQLESIIRVSFGNLGPLIIDMFFANFGYAMPLSPIPRLDKLCRTLRQDLVIEFGSGVSAVAITDALVGSEGFLISIDESIKWLENTYRLVNHPPKAAFVCAPADGGINHTMLSKVLSLKGKPELVIIAGPSGGERFSEPALRLYQELLSTCCICAVDDTDREENNLGASQLVADFSLRRVDYSDPIYVHHQYSILLPSHFDDHVFLVSSTRMG